MLKVLFIFLLLAMVMGFSDISAQNPIPQGLFKSPLDIPLSLAGNFAELRKDHFHSGLDLKTQGRQGLLVRASAAGNISRIKVSLVGFGKVIYMDHPEGYTTVYAHLYTFNDNINKLIDSLQGASHSFEVEIFPDSNRFHFEQGDILGLSGNSGGSEAPHLHFEIRDRKSEEPINPLWAGLAIPDTTYPVFRNFLIYGFKDEIWSLKLNRVFSDSLVLKEDTVYLDTDTAGIGFASLDLDSLSQIGIYSATLKANDSTIFQFAYDRFNFNESRYVNAHIDYEWNFLSKIKGERCFRLANDSCSIFKNAGNGFIILNDSVPVKIDLSISDFSGNRSNIRMYLYKKVTDTLSHKYDKNIIDCRKSFLFADHDFTFSIPKGALYQNEAWKYDTSLPPKKLKTILLSRIYEVMNPGIPFQKPVYIKMKFKHLPVADENKIVLVELNVRNSIIPMGPCKKEKDVYSGFIRKGGRFAFVADTIPPSIDSIGFVPDPVTADSVLYVAVSDNLSGLKTYNVFIDDEWTLSEWDPRVKCIFIYPKMNNYGPHKVKIELTDGSNNPLTSFFLL